MAAEPRIPTTLPEGVREALPPLLAGVQDALGDAIRGVYLYGSAVAGDFDARRSDLDLLVALEDDADDVQLGRIERLHRDFAGSHPVWEDRIDAAYLAVRALRRCLREQAPIVVISPGEPLHRTRTRPGWPMNWYAVRQEGVALLGPPARECIAEMGAADFEAAVRFHMGDMLALAEALGTPAYLAYAAVTSCRALHSCSSGGRLSKPAAVEWVARRSPEWADCVRAALGWRRRAPDDPIDPARVEVFLAFVRHVAQQVGAPDPRGRPAGAA